jgi:hypothetical protein
MKEPSSPTTIGSRTWPRRSRSTAARASWSWTPRPLEEIEDEYGGDAYGEVRQRLLGILEEQRGKDYRNEDVITLDKPRGLRFVVFLDRKRRRGQPSTVGDLKSVRSRMMSSLVPNLAGPRSRTSRACPASTWATPWPCTTPHAPERIVRRAVRDALAVAAHHRQAEELRSSSACWTSSCASGGHRRTSRSWP